MNAASRGTAWRAHLAGSVARDADRLIDRDEAAVLAGVAPQQLGQLVEHADFPEALFIRLRVDGRVEPLERWRRGEVIAWVERLATLSAIERASAERDAERAARKQRQQSAQTNTPPAAAPRTGGQK